MLKKMIVRKDERIGIAAETLWLWHRFEFASAAFKKAEIPPQCSKSKEVLPFK